MAPIINDVATDLVNPPEFVKNKPLPDAFKPQIFQAYKTELQPLKLEATKQAAFEACQAACKRMQRWTLTREDPAEGMIQGYAVTGLLRFTDDFVIRVTEDGTTARVDMRSKSRLGKGDLGANAARIRAYLQDLASNAGCTTEWLPLQEASSS